MSGEARGGFGKPRLINTLCSSTALTGVAPATRARAKALPEVLAAVLLASAVGVSPASAEIRNGAGQAGFDTLVPQATQPGANDTVNITLGEASGGVEVRSDMSLPGGADGLRLNFSNDPGSDRETAQFTVNNDAVLEIGSGVSIDFDDSSRFNVGLGDGERGSVLLDGGTIHLDQVSPSRASYLNIGEGGIGTFTQASGSVVLDNSAFQIGAFGGTGLYDLSGGSVDLNSASTIYLGRGEGSDGTLLVTGDAQFTFQGQAFIGIGQGAGRIVQDGAASLVSINTGPGDPADSEHDIYFGWTGNDGGAAGGQGSYELRSGTFELRGEKGVTFGKDTGGSGDFIQSGGVFTAEGIVTIGGSGAGTYDVSGGTSAMNGGLTLANGSSASGTVTQAGGDVSVGGSGLAFKSGNGTYNLNGGTLTVGAIGGGNASRSFFNFGGGTLVASGSFATAGGFVTNFNAASTIQVNGTDTLTWNSPISGDGTLGKTGTGTLTLAVANSFTGDVSLRGGTLALGNAQGLNGGAIATSSGTTLDLTGLGSTDIVVIGPLSGAGQVKLGDSHLVSIIGAGQSAAFSGTITSDAWGYEANAGTFTKAGDGNLVINGSTMDRGESFIIAGSMTQSDGTTAWTNINVGSGNGSTGALNISGGSLTLNVGLRVGDFGGDGTVNQTGGTVTLEQTCGTPKRCPSLNIGNQGGSGVYNISGGSLLLQNGSHSIGRNEGSNPASEGTLNISGNALVQLSGGGFLAIGDRDEGTKPNSTGVIKQTGGTLRIVGASRFYLGGYGDGTYNLDGGALEIGGSSLLGLYGSSNTTGTYAFMLGGGTIRVIGSDLITSVDATLVSGTTSTIDTNGLNATWNGVLSGEGNLAKAGEGTLTLSAANTFTGDVAVRNGTLALTNVNGLGATNGVAVGSGAVFDISAAAGSSTASVDIGMLSGGGTVDVGNNSLVVNIGAGSASAFGGTFLAAKHSYESDGAESSLIKAGAGTLVINGMSAQTGSLYVREGTLEQSARATGIAYLAVGSGSAAVPGNNATLNISGGLLNIGEALQVGDWGGAGTVNQTGGIVTVSATCGDAAHCASFNIGNQGGSGAYNIDGGSLILVGGLHSVGRNTSGQDGGSGTLNISGGLVELRRADGAYGPGSIIIGDRSSGGVSEASGTITQTGGIFRIGAGTNLYLGGYGSGTFNLNGGALEVGGDSLRGSYAGGSGYAFNLGGGTIRVTGTNLTTAVNATLTGGTISTIDTNGRDATWNGVFSGAGTLAKAGAGTLTLTSTAHSYSGGTLLLGGTLRAGAGVLGGGPLSFGGTGTFAFAGGYTLANDVTLGSGAIGRFDVAAGNVSTLSGQISGAGGLAKLGLGELVLSGTDNIYTGPTRVTQGTLTIANAGALSDASALNVATGASFRLLGVRQTVTQLDGDGSVQLGAGAALNIADLGGNSVFSGSISGEGGITKSGTGQLTLTGINPYTGPTLIDSGRLVVDGTVPNSPITVRPGGTLGGTGTVHSVTLTGSSTLAPGHSPGTLTVLNDVAFDAGSTYEAEFDGAAHDLVVLQNGSATINDGAILDIRLLSTVSLGTPYPILQVADGSSGAIVVPGDGFTVNDTLNKPLLTGMVGYSDTAVTVTFDGISTPWAEKVATRNQGAAANAVQSLGLGNPLYEAAVYLDAPQLDQTFDLLSGEINASAKGVLIGDSDFLRSAVFARLASAGQPGGANGIVVAPQGRPSPASGPVAEAPERAVWMQAFGSWGSTDGNGNAARLDRDTGGFFIGADTLLDGWRIGVLGGYSQTNFDVDARASSGDSDNVHAGAYAGTNWGPVNFRAGAALSWHSVSTTRSAFLSGPQTLKADYDAFTTQAFGEIGYGVRAGIFDFEPFAGLAYVNLHTDGFTETGGAAALSDSGDTTGVGYATVGLRGSTGFDLGPAKATLRGMLGWRHAFGDIDPTSTYRFAAGSSPFTVAGVPIAEDSLLVDVGMDVALNRSVSLNVAYRGQVGDGSTDQSVRGSFVWRF